MVAFLVGDQAASLQLGRRAIHALQWSGDRVRMGLVLHMIAAALAPTRPDAATIIQGIAQAHAVGSAPRMVELSSQLAATLGEEHTRELRARGADMEWDQAIAYALTQITQALNELESQAQP